MCAIEDCEPATIWNETHRNARKQHLCEECGRRIQPGETYRHVKILDDGRWSRYLECSHCEAAGTWLHAVCGGYPTSMLHEELDEHWDEGYRSVGMGRLIVGVKHGWHDGRDPIPDATQVRELALSMMRQAVA